MKISSTTKEKLAGDFYSIDQSCPALPATPLTASGPAIKMTIERINSSYRRPLGQGWPHPSGPDPGMGKNWY